jgi:hypothetical protein
VLIGDFLASSLIITSCKKDNIWLSLSQAVFLAASSLCCIFLILSAYFRQSFGVHDDLRCDNVHQFAFVTAIHIVIRGHRDLLSNAAHSRTIIDGVKGCKPAGVWLWFSRFDEHGASLQELRSLRSWVEELSNEMPVFNMHGSYFSLALSKLGMAGIAHGVGYGEQKDVVPVIGQSTPTVQYYVRSLHAKFSVLQITRCFTALGITTPEEFFETICDCVICKNIIGKDLNAFGQFGEIHYSRPQSKRASQTPAAAKRCRFHFLLNRHKERDYVSANTLRAIADNCNAAADQWRKTILAQSIEHLRTWADVLS